jgi:thioredoxin reductase/pSer/pThr/pTyr-binding forkhead associated (FHA) protein
MDSPFEYKPDGTLLLNSPVSLPELLDMLIVGGGPAGTAAAFHAKELGLSALVIDYDDLMKRIRDYPKDKLILPDFGGGDQMKFPKGGNLISLLHFPPLDKDDMCATWKRFYRESSIPAQVGIELLGMDRRADGIWNIKSWNHNTKTEKYYLAKHIAIGIGRGVPRRFDIPGNTDGIAYRLADAAAYVGAPALILGGGTSAAEAVIAISNAKAKSNDASAVYWSYRGDKLPKVSKALAEVFFDAYMGNGNIRYFPNSEPVAVVTADDRKDYLSLRTDRRCIEGRPNETAHLEFSKEFCIACIGEDIPEGFLNSMGIFMATGGPSNKKRMVTSPILETQQPNVYLIGDILSQAYLETDNFDGDPATFREVKHRGNIKSAIRDGVLVAKVAAQRIAGKKELDIELDFEEDAKQEKAPPPKERALSIVTMIVEGAMAPASAGKEQVEEPQAYLIKKLAGNVEEDEFAVNLHGITTIGRKFCDIVFPEDEMLSERHASLIHSLDGYSLRDDGSETGVFLKAQEGRLVEVFSGDLVRLGRQFLLFHNDGGKFSFSHYDQTGKFINTHMLTEKTIVLGRDAPDVTLEGKDMTLSRRHLSIAVKDGKVVIKDLKSVNGTYLKVRNTVKLDDRDEFRLGRQAFTLSVQKERAPERIRISTKATVVLPAPSEKPSPPPTVPIAKKEPMPQAGKGEAPVGMLISFTNAGGSFEVKKGQTICEVAEQNGVKIVAECHAGICGSDPVRIHSGKENCNPAGGDEKGTLEDICGLTAGECRLACMVKPTGPLVVEIIKA